MKTQEIIKICEKNKDEFENIIKDICYEQKGIFNSEMLLVFSLVKHLNIKEIWESGRARGQSTKILAECFKNLKIYSIEILKDTEDDNVSLNRLKEYNNLVFLYGNSVEIMLKEKFESKEVAVLIDGPKGMKAINLASLLLKNKNVRIVFLHDYHKDSPLRGDIEEKYKNVFFTDNKKYVEKFKNLDDKCWIEHAKIDRYLYRRGNKEMKSYSSTLCVIFNEL